MLHISLAFSFLTYIDEQFSVTAYCLLSLLCCMLFLLLFLQLCVHPADKARKALVDGMRGLLFNCSYTLKRSKLLLLVSFRSIFPV